MKTVRTRILEAVKAVLEALAGDGIPPVAAVVWGADGDRNNAAITQGCAAGSIVFELLAGDDELVDPAQGFNIVHKRFEAGAIVYLPDDRPDGSGGQLSPEDLAGRVHAAIVAAVAADPTWGGLAVDSEDQGGGGAFWSSLAGAESFAAISIDYRHLRGDLFTAA